MRICIFLDNTLTTVSIIEAGADSSYFLKTLTNTSCVHLQQQFVFNLHTSNRAGYAEWKLVGCALEGGGSLFDLSRHGAPRTALSPALSCHACTMCEHRAPVVLQEF